LEGPNSQERRQGHCESLDFSRAMLAGLVRAADVLAHHDGFDKRLEQEYAELGAEMRSFENRLLHVLGAVRSLDGKTSSSQDSGPGSRMGSFSHFAVYSCRKAPEVEGVHSCGWWELVSKLPGRDLLASGARLKGFNSAADAISAYRAHTGVEPIVHAALDDDDDAPEAVGLLGMIGNAFSRVLEDVLPPTTLELLGMSIPDYDEDDDVIARRRSMGRDVSREQIRRRRRRRRTNPNSGRSFFSMFPGPLTMLRAFFGGMAASTPMSSSAQCGGLGMR